MTKKGRDKHKDKFDQDTADNGMGIVDNKNSDEERGINSTTSRDKSEKGEGLEEFIDDK